MAAIVGRKRPIEELALEIAQQDDDDWQPNFPFLTAKKCRTHNNMTMHFLPESSASPSSSWNPFISTPAGSVAEHNHAAEEVLSLSSAVLGRKRGFDAVDAEVLFGGFAKKLKQQQQQQQDELFPESAWNPNPNPGSAYSFCYSDQSNGNGNHGNGRDRARMKMNMRRDILEKRCEEERRLMTKILEKLLSDNDILKKGVNIQHRRLKEVAQNNMATEEQLKHEVLKLREEVSNLKMKNYELTLRLQQSLCNPLPFASFPPPPPPPSIC